MSILSFQPKFHISEEIWHRRAFKTALGRLCHLRNIKFFCQSDILWYLTKSILIWTIISVKLVSSFRNLPDRPIGPMVYTLQLLKMLTICWQFWRGCHLLTLDQAPSLILNIFCKNTVKKSQCNQCDYASSQAGLLLTLDQAPSLILDIFCQLILFPTSSSRFPPFGIKILLLTLDQAPSLILGIFWPFQTPSSRFLPFGIHLFTSWPPLLEKRCLNMIWNGFWNFELRNLNFFSLGPHTGDQCPSVCRDLFSWKLKIPFGLGAHNCPSVCRDLFPGKMEKILEWWSL